MIKQDWVGRFPGLRELAAGVVDHLIRGSEVVDLVENSRLFGPGQSPGYFLLLLDGSIRVQQIGECGREIILYRVAAGESCALTSACLMGYDEYRAEGIAETHVRAVAVKRLLFDEMISSSSAFRNLVFKAFSHRITNLLQVIEDITFQRLDVRLAQLLIKLAGDCGEVIATHQALANELGSAREVVSRQLNEFRKRGWLKGARGAITIVSRVAIEALAGGRH